MYTEMREKLGRMAESAEDLSEIAARMLKTPTKGTFQRISKITRSGPNANSRYLSRYLVPGGIVEAF